MLLVNLVELNIHMAASDRAEDLFSSIVVNLVELNIPIAASDHTEAQLFSLIVYLDKYWMDI